MPVKRLTSQTFCLEYHRLFRRASPGQIAEPMARVHWCLMESAKTAGTFASLGRGSHSRAADRGRNQPEFVWRKQAHDAKRTDPAASIPTEIDHESSDISKPLDGSADLIRNDDPTMPGNMATFR